MTNILRNKIKYTLVYHHKWASQIFSRNGRANTRHGLAPFAVYKSAEINAFLRIFPQIFLQILPQNRINNDISFAYPIRILMVFH